MIWDILFFVCLGCGVVGMILYFIWLYNPALFAYDYLPDTIKLDNGEVVDVTIYPKFSHTIGCLISKGIMTGDLLICDPEYSPKLYVHDVVITLDDVLFVIDTCHKDGTYTLKNDGVVRPRVDRDTIAYVVKYIYDRNANRAIKL